MKKVSTKKALIASVLSMLVCVSMLIGSTFAWFTDSASTGVNVIKAGNLNVDIVSESGDSLDGKTLGFKDVNGNTDVVWEPGATFNLDAFKIVNKGNLAFKYKVIISGLNGDSELLDVIDFTVKKGEETSVALADWDGVLLPEGATATDVAEVKETELITISGHMHEDAGNEYMDKKLDGIAIKVVATQYAYESDSNGNTYDENAEAEINVNKDNVQDYLDGKYGSLDGMTLVLAAGDYGTLEIGRATAYAGSNTKYYTFKGGYDSVTEITEYTTAEDLSAGVQSGIYYGNLKYVRSINNVTLKAADGAVVNIAGVELASAHIYGTSSKTVHDYVLNNDIVDTNKSFWLVHRIKGINFKGVSFAGNVNISSSLKEAAIDGVTFENCSFTTGGTTSDKGQAIRYYNEINNGKVKNLVVKECTFENCYQGVYTMNVRDISVIDCSFDTTGHNAVAVQSDGADHGAVVITGNIFANIGDRIIRFNKVGADTQITIRNNTATNSGKGGQVIKAESLADGITYDIGGNSWGEGSSVGNTEFADR